MPATGYYDVNRGLLGNALAPAAGKGANSGGGIYFDEANPVWQSYANNPAYKGLDFRDYMLTPVATSTDTTQHETSPGSNDYWSPADIGGGYALQITPEAQLRKSRDARNAQDNVALTFAAIVGGLAAAGAGGGAAGAGANTGAGLSDIAVPSAGNYLAPIAGGGGAAGGAAAGAAGLSDVAVPSAGSYLAPVGAGGGAGAGAAAVGPPSSLAGSATSMVPPEGASSGGWQQQVKRLFHMGGNSGSQRQPYRYQNPTVADYAQQQQAAEMLADALNKRQPIDPIVRGGPIPIGRY